MNAVTWVIAKTKTRSKKSSSVVTEWFSRVGRKRMRAGRTRVGGATAVILTPAGHPTEGPARPSRRPRARARLALGTARVARIPREGAVAVVPGELERGHGVLGRPQVEAVGAQHHVSGVGADLGDQSSVPVVEGEQLTRDEVPAAADHARDPLEDAVGVVAAEAHDHQLGMTEAEQADRVAEGRLARLLPSSDVLHDPAVGADGLGGVRV